MPRRRRRCGQQSRCGHQSQRQRHLRRRRGKVVLRKQNGDHLTPVHVVPLYNACHTYRRQKQQCDNGRRKTVCRTWPNNAKVALPYSPLFLPIPIHPSASLSLLLLRLLLLPPSPQCIDYSVHSQCIDYSAYKQRNSNNNKTNATTATTTTKTATATKRTATHENGPLHSVRTQK